MVFRYGVIEGVIESSTDTGNAWVVFFRVSDEETDGRILYWLRNGDARWTNRSGTPFVVVCPD